MVERRLTVLAAIVLLWGGAILFYLVKLQILQHKDYVTKARSHQEMVVEIPAPRGSIYDREGRPLAMSLASRNVIVNPAKIDIGVASDLLGQLLHLDRSELFLKIQQAKDAKRGYLVVKKEISQDEYENLLHLKKQGVAWFSLENEHQRHYPNGTLAAHVLGGVDFEERGNAGIEKGMEKELRGIPGSIRLLADVHGRGIQPQKEIPAKPGTPLTLTIDERVQFVAEREIAAAVQSHNAVSGSVVVMKPDTGDILAMASYPTYDPNADVKGADDLKARNNHAFSVPFEPGSVFKTITYSAAFETTNLRPETMINCNGGVLRLGIRTIHDSHGGTWVVPASYAYAHSSNIGAIQVGFKVGQQSMYDYMLRFGFGRKTGLPLPGESPGKVYKLEKWGKTSLASVAMGQEVSVTTVQLAQAASIVANGGFLVKPRLVLKRGERMEPVAQPVRILKPETAITMRQMMEGVVLNGTGSKARLAGYTSGGKTGSAQIFDYATKHYTHTYNGSFMGFAPVTNPQVVVVVTLNGTHGESGFGGSSAAPVFKVVTSEALRVFDVPKDLPENLPLTLVAKNASGFDDLASDELDRLPGNLLAEDDEQGSTEAAQIAAGTMQGPPVAVAPAPPKPQGPRVPNFRGMTMRAVLAEAAAKGLSVLPAGNGIARVQSPPPGAPLQQGERIRVQFVQ